MTSLLIIIVLVLLAVALWQLTKIFDLTQVGSNSDTSEVATDDDNNVQGYIMFAFLAFLYVFTIYRQTLFLGILLLTQLMDAFLNQVIKLPIIYCQTEKKKFCN